MMLSASCRLFRSLACSSTLGRGAARGLENSDSWPEGSLAAFRKYKKGAIAREEGCHGPAPSRSSGVVMGRSAFQLGNHLSGIQSLLAWAAVARLVGRPRCSPLANVGPNLLFGVSPFPLASAHGAHLRRCARTSRNISEPLTSCSRRARARACCRRVRKRSRAKKMYRTPKPTIRPAATKLGLG